MYASFGVGQKNSKSRSSSKSGKGRGAKPKSDLTCYNCRKVGHVKAGQGPHQKSTKKGGSAKDASGKSAKDTSGKKDELANWLAWRNLKPLLLPAHLILQRLHLDSPLSQKGGLELS